jgi:hypothetical protein
MVCEKELADEIWYWYLTGEELRVLPKFAIAICSEVTQ